VARVSAADYNRATYDRIWSQMSDFIRYNPGARHRRRHVFALLERFRFDSLLDVGCGNGELLRLVDARWPGRSLAGVDLSAAVVDANRAALPRMAFHVANIERDTLPTGFDAVVCCEVLEHLDDPASALAKLAQAARPGGRVVVTTPTGKVWPTERHFGHVRHPQPRDLEGWAASAGLVVEELWSWGFPLYALTKWAANVNPDAALKAFAGEKRYGPAQIALSTALFAANFVNLRSSSRGVQLFALFRRP
jgi:2-polyprenyl-3-methyl-5-hydroxy-6-metoxy-1,4-benzoquinol methylase